MQYFGPSGFVLLSRLGRNAGYLHFYSAALLFLPVKSKAGHPDDEDRPGPVLGGSLGCWRETVAQRGKCGT